MGSNTCVPITAVAPMGRSYDSPGLCDTASMTTVLIAIALYLTATALLVVGVGRDTSAARHWLLPALAAVALRATTHLLAWRHSGSADMHFFAALSLVGLGMAVLTALVGGLGRMAALGVMVFPLAALTLLGYQSYGHVPAQPLDWRLQLHAWFALLAYATLAVAALLAVMLWLQERALRRREFHRWLRALPPLVELETLLFRHHGRLRVAHRDPADRHAVRREPARPAPCPQDRAERVVVAGVRRPAARPLALRLARRHRGALDAGGDGAAGDGVLRQQVRARTGPAPAALNRLAASPFATGPGHSIIETTPALARPFLTGMPLGRIEHLRQPPSRCPRCAPPGGSAGANLAERHGLPAQ